ncbi:LIM-type zinc finger-containing protein [Tieghemostelium lacteum]|uniref:LIM-type zinc finger-containing protein n=1 Tax=Tieghemostelium lacteum TaxID=361077 RepID=A0A151ZGI2_TIELA|nr:LIM-type zinc finger-containing protein [Tieghemostelium lacteum]|eukprot:KYQ93081.1 LIM-type zinc finger-containing protein [Tieghemostelium lacteum]
MHLVRKIVSKQKKRFEWGNFDLDLTYLTDRVIGMGFPSESIEGLYRNNMKDVQRFFNTLHPGHYKIYNLCSERKYDHDRFEGNVSEYPFDDHSPPNLDVIGKFCLDVEEWLDQHPENIVAIHCKAGKGRTGTMVACWLLYNRSCTTSSESIRMFGTKRTHNGKGITIPSQARYVRYFEALNQYGKPTRPAPSITKILSTIRMSSLPDFNIGGGCEPYLCITQQDKNVFYTKPLKIKKGQSKAIEIDCGNIILCNDVKLKFYNKNSKGYMFSYCFHTAFIDSSKVSIRRVEIDKAHKDTKHFPNNFSIELEFVEEFTEDDLIEVGFKSDSPSTSKKNTIDISNNNNNNNNNNQHQGLQLYGTSYINNLDKLFTNKSSGSIPTNITLVDVPVPTTTTTTTTSTTLENINKNNNNNDIVTNERPISSKEVFNCPKCNLNILSTEVSVNNGLNNYHWSCLNCDNCSKSLMKDNNCLFQGSKTLCFDCGTTSGFFKFCSGCNLVIKNSNFEEFGDLVFHNACFFCSTCLNYLVGKDFIIKEKKLLQCSTCVERANNEIKKDVNNINHNVNQYEHENFNQLKDQSFLVPIKPTEINNNEIKVNNNNNNEIIVNQQDIILNEQQEDNNNNTIEIEKVDAIIEEQENKKEEKEEEITNEFNIICTKCNEPIGLRPIILDSGVYHRDCFQCAECNRLLDFNGYFSKNQESQPICSQCDKALMKKQKNLLFQQEEEERLKYSQESNDDALTTTLSNVICYGCKLIIEDEEMMDALGEKWHLQCLTCTTCRKQIEGAFGDHQGLIYCKDHYEELFGLKCNQCDQIIDGVFIKFNGKQLHAHCFVCFNCNKILQDGKYYEKNGYILCEFCRSVDIIKRRTQLQLQQSFIGVKRSTTSNNLSSNNNNNSILMASTPLPTIPDSIVDVDKPLSTSYLCINKNNSYRHSTRINLSDFKFSTLNASERRGKTLYPSLHRQISLKFKTAYPSSRIHANRKDFLSLNKSLTTTI